MFSIYTVFNKMNKVTYLPKRFILLAMAITLLFLNACSSIPGEDNAAKIQTIDELVEQTLIDLYLQNPEAQQAIKESVGYAILSNNITKIPLIGAGRGYGVAINNTNQQKHYVRMSRFDIGGGWGVRSVRPVAIFTDEKVFNEFIQGMWFTTFGAEAAAKVGDVGVSGGEDINKLGNDKGYTIHMIIDTGVSATLTLGIVKINPISLKNK